MDEVVSRAIAVLLASGAWQGLLTAVALAVLYAVLRYAIARAPHLPSVKPDEWSDVTDPTSPGPQPPRVDATWEYHDPPDTFPP